MRVINFNSSEFSLWLPSTRGKWYWLSIGTITKSPLRRTLSKRVEDEYEVIM